MNADNNPAFPANPLCCVGDPLVTLESANNVMTLLGAIDYACNGHQFEMPEVGKYAMEEIRRMARDAVKHASDTLYVEAVADSPLRAKPEAKIENDIPIRSAEAEPVSGSEVDQALNCQRGAVFEAMGIVRLAANAIQNQPGDDPVTVDAWTALDGAYSLLERIADRLEDRKALMKDVPT